MEHSQILDTDRPNSEGLAISANTIGFLRETARWTKFLSIIGFVVIGLLVIVAIFAGTFLSSLPTGGMPMPSMFFTLIYLVMAALYYFPVYYLFRFSTKLSDALKTNDSAYLEMAFENLKSHYKFIGIMAAIVLGIYALMFVFSIAMGGFALLNM